MTNTPMTIEALYEHWIDMERNHYDSKDGFISLVKQQRQQAAEAMKDKFMQLITEDEKHWANIQDKYPNPDSAYGCLVGLANLKNKLDHLSPEDC